MRKMIATLSIATVSISLFASLLHAQDVYTDNVVVVLDASGSMNESMRVAHGNRVQKMAAAKLALYEVLKQIPDTTHVGLLVFSGSGKRGDWVYPLGKKDDTKLKKAIDPIAPGGGTPLGKYIKIGGDRLLKEREKQHGYGSYRLLIVTDGEAQDSSLVDRHTPEVIARGITVDVIGVAMGARHTLATKVHSYRSADDPASLARAIQEVFAEVSATGSRDVGEDAFAELAGIPNEVATAMIKAFGTTGNYPIGEKPKTKVAKTRDISPIQHSPTQPPVAQSQGIPLLLVILTVVVIVAVVVFLFRAVARR